MSHSTLPTALKLIFGHEGGYSNRSTDRGGPTKYGITLATLSAHRGRKLTAADVKKLTLPEAETIYRKSYWTQAGGDILPVGLDYACFDFGINSGPARGNRVLQQVVGTAPDGIIGVKTLDAVNKYPGGIENLIRDYCAARMRYLESLTDKNKGFPVNGRGWTIRVTGVDPKKEYAPKPGVIGEALDLARGHVPAAPKTVESVALANPVDIGITQTTDGTAGIAAGVGIVATALTDAAGQLAPFSGLPALRWLFIGLTVAGVVAGLYATIKRIQAGNG